MNDSHCTLEAKPRRRRWMFCLPNLAMLPRRRRMLHQAKSASPIILLPDDLIVEIISWLPVKTLMKFKCVNKFFKTTIFDPHFVQMHLNRSSRNSHVAKFRGPGPDTSFVTLSIPDLLEKNITILHNSPLYELKDYLNTGHVVGSCNGLICFNFFSFHYGTDWLCFWNPARRTTSKRFTTFTNPCSYYRIIKYSFGYDNSAGTYKAVAFYVEEEKHGYNPKPAVKVFTLGDNSWRDIQCFPVLPIYWSERRKNNGVYISGTINWLALRNYFSSDYSFDWLKGVTVEQYVIVSLDLSTESYTQMLLPRGFVEVPRHVQPTVVVLKNCLCFGHDFKGIRFVIWQMKNFGVQESWVQLFKISYWNWGYCFEPLEFLPLYLSKNGYTFIFAKYESGQAFVYNCIDNKIEQIRTTNKAWWLWVTNYIESLVPTS